MTQSTTPAAPGSNVIAPAPGIWPPFPPGRPPAVPPSCFSQLYALNQCYDDILAMQAILTKVICDQATNNAEFAQCLATAIGKVGSGTPLAGVTNGVAAAPGIVGEYVQQEASGTTTGAANQMINLPNIILQPGDWDLEAWLFVDGDPTGAQLILNPQPPGFSNQMWTQTGSAPGTTGFITLVSPRAQALVSVPTLVPFSVTFNIEGAGTPGNYAFIMSARRMR